MLDKVKEFLAKANDAGIPLPLFRDPKTHLASISFTLLVLSFLYAAIMIVLNVSKQVENISYVMELFYASAALYFGRTLGTKGRVVQVSEEKGNEGNE